jgi:uncharacterized membrane protein
MRPLGPMRLYMPCYAGISTGVVVVAAAAAAKAAASAAGAGAGAAAAAAAVVVLLAVLVVVLVLVVIAALFGLIFLVELSSVLRMSNRKHGFIT